MAKNNTRHEINLLPKEEFEGSTLGRTLKWVLTTFRYIVIGTEMIVMIAFLSRFWLDSRSSDLIDAINQKKAVVSSYSTFEEQFRSTQNKLKIFTQYTDVSEKISPILDSISQQMPADVTLSQINIDGSKLQIVAITKDENEGTNFIKNLNSTKYISNAQIISIQSVSQDALSITISGTLKERTGNAI